MAWLVKATKTCRRVSVYVIGAWAIFCFLVAPFAEGKKRGSGRFLPLKIVEITTSPSPYEIGTGELSLSIVVRLPKQLKGADLLEFTALISSPSRSSMRFLTQRMPLPQANPQTNSHVHTTLFWDGKDQSQKPVDSGTYRYEVRAKLMAQEGDGPRTKMESPRSHGTVEVINKKKSP
jgi:hypothetical protein